MAQQIGTITIEKLYGGWTDDLSLTDTHATEGGVNQYSQSTGLMINRPGFEGHLAPGIVFTDFTDTGTIVAGLPLNVVVDNNSLAWTILDNGRLVWWSLSDTNTPSTIQNISRSATLTIGSQAITVSTSKLTVGMRVTGTGIPFGTYIGTISGSSVFLNNNATANGAQTLVFSAYHDVTNTVQAGTISSGSVVIGSLPETGSLSVGMPVTGTGIPASTLIASITDLTNITLSATATATTTATFTFGTAASNSGYNDVVIYPSQSGTPPTNTIDNWIFWSWNNDTQGDVGKRVNNDTTGYYRTFSDTYLTGLPSENQENGTALIKAVPHPLILGPFNSLYIGNGRYVALHDPTTTTVNYMALDIGPGWVINGFALHQGLLAILAYKANSTTQGGFQTKSESKVFLWDGYTLGWNQEFDLRDFYASNILQDGTDLYVLTQGRNGTVKLKYFAGYGFQTVFEAKLAGNVPEGSINGTPVFGAIDLYLNQIVWNAGTGSGKINMWGSPSERQPKGFHSICVNPTFTGVTNGMIKNLINDVVYVGHYDGSSRYSLQHAAPSTATFDINAMYRSALFPIPTNTTITAIKVYFSQFGTGASVNLSLVKDYGAAGFGGATDLFNTTINSTDYSGYTYVPVVKSVDNANAIYLQINWAHATTNVSAAIIRKVEIEYLYDDGNI